MLKKNHNVSIDSRNSLDQKKRSRDTDNGRYRRSQPLKEYSRNGLIKNQTDIDLMGINYQHY